MVQNIIISRTTGTRALCVALFAGLVLLTTRTAQNIMAAFKISRAWLRAQHDFYGQDGDPIKCTGWQFVGYNIAAVVVAVLFSIKYYPLLQPLYNNTEY